MVETPPREHWRRIASGAADIVPEDALRELVDAQRPLRVKLGVDPTAAHVHLGWAVVLRKLRTFQDLGHTAVLIVGDFTARIGDPSGQNKTRPMLTKEQVDAYVERLLEQFGLVLDLGALEVRRNSEWLEPLGVEGVLRLGSRYTVAQMLQRDDFAKRYAAGTPISVTELLYPLMQAYDSVAVAADVELGGTDQTFNLLVGRDIQEKEGQRPQCILTMPLLEGTDGVKKMSQSLGNYIGITEPPEEIFGKLMRVPDELVPKYLRLTTALDPDTIEGLEADIASGALRPDVAKRRLGREVVALYHSEEAAAGAEEHFDRLFKRHEAPEDVEEHELPAAAVEDGTAHLPLVLKSIFGLSSSEARRVIEQGGVKLDGQTVGHVDVPADALRGKMLQVGKRRFARIR